MTELPVVNSCEGCGSCCRGTGVPLGYGMFFPPPGHSVPEWAKEGLDWELYRTMPTQIRKTLEEYYAALRTGIIEPRDADGLTPCLWYDEVAKQCRHHEWRPRVCRDFELGSDACHRLRTHWDSIDDQMRAEYRDFISSRMAGRLSPERLVSSIRIALGSGHLTYDDLATIRQAIEEMLSTE